MKMLYYYVDSDGATQGPVNIGHFKTNFINGHSWVWHDGLPQWVEAHTVPSLRSYMRSDLPASFSTKKGIVDLEKERMNIPVNKVLPKTELDVLRSRVPKTWMIEAVLTTIFCCIPFGIVAIIYASRVAPYWRKGFYGESIASSNKAGLWVKISVVLTIMIWVIYTLLWIFTPLAEKSAIWYNNVLTSPIGTY